MKKAYCCIQLTSWRANKKTSFDMISENCTYQWSTRTKLCTLLWLVKLNIRIKHQLVSKTKQWLHSGHRESWEFQHNSTNILVTILTPKYFDIVYTDDHVISCLISMHIQMTNVKYAYTTDSIKHHFTAAWSSYNTACTWGLLQTCSIYSEFITGTDTTNWLSFGMGIHQWPETNMYKCQTGEQPETFFGGGRYKFSKTHRWTFLGRYNNVYNKVNNH